MRTINTINYNIYIFNITIANKQTKEPKRYLAIVPARCRPPISHFVSQLPAPSFYYLFHVLSDILRTLFPQLSEHTQRRDAKVACAFHSMFLKDVNASSTPMKET